MNAPLFWSIAWPVTPTESSDRSHATVPAISLGSLMRRSGTSCFAISHASSSVSPSNTDMTRLGLSLFEGLTEEEAWEVAKQEVPLRRMSDPGEIAGTVAWLLSDDSIGVTGQAIDQNNGAFMI